MSKQQELPRRRMGSSLTVSVLAIMFMIVTTFFLCKDIRNDNEIQRCRLPDPEHRRLLSLRDTSRFLRPRPSTPIDTKEQLVAKPSSSQSKDVAGSSDPEGRHNSPDQVIVEVGRRPRSMIAIPIPSANQATATKEADPITNSAEKRSALSTAAFHPRLARSAHSSSKPPHLPVARTRRSSRPPLRAAPNSSRPPRTSGAASQPPKASHYYHKMQKKKMMNKKKQKEMAAPRSLDFVVAGFPKCGTTTLLYALNHHPETEIAQAERCGITSLALSDKKAELYITKSLDELSAPKASTVGATRYGIKCPAAIQSSTAIARIEDFNLPGGTAASLIIGLRHPIELLESFYNYRVTEIYTKKTNETIPSFDSIVMGSGQNDWKGVSLDITRFDFYLSQLGKTPVSQTTLNELAGRKGVAIKPTSGKVFLYALQQLDDANYMRSRAFRQSLQHFLKLKTPFSPLGHENLNHFVGEQAYPQTVNICDARYQPLRTKLLAQGVETAQWIENEFMQSPDVTIANREHFILSLATWGVDPCLSKPPAAQPSA